MDQEDKVVTLERHRLNKQFARIIETMGGNLMPWKTGLKEGSFYITVDAAGMVYGEILEFLGGDFTHDPDGVPLIAASNHFSEEYPRGKREEIFLAQVWGILTEKQFQRAEDLGWPAARGRFLDQVVTDDPRYTIIFSPSSADFE
jgi:hypothetical protein